jgi:tRNA-2-methylthio-N6-dimethylallyladenosine synthase
VVNFAGNPRLVGQMVDVTITEAKAYTLRGEVRLREATPVA